MRARRQRNLSRHQKFFCKNVFHRKAYPLYRDGTIFGQVFVRGGMIKISKWKVPPYRGSIARRQPFDGLTALGARLCSLLRPPAAHAHSFEIRQHAPTAIAGGWPASTTSESSRPIGSRRCDIPPCRG